LLVQFLLVAFATAQNTPSQEPAPILANEAEAESKVEINSIKNPDWKSYQTMLKGLATFDQYRALAPQAEAKFLLKPRNASASIQDLHLRLATDDNAISIALSDKGFFITKRSSGYTE